MKILKSIFIFCLIIIFIFPLISSVSIEIKPEYQKGETMIIKVTGGFIDNIKKEDIFFYRGYMPTFMSEYDVVEIQEQFFIYVKPGLEKIPGNYSIHIKDVRYTQGSQIISDDIIGNFSITNNYTDFWVYPGAKIATEDYSLQVQNLQQETIIINIDYNSGTTADSGFFSSWFGGGEGETNVEVFSGQIKNIDFPYIWNTSLDEIHLRTENTEYFIPVYSIYQEEPYNYTPPIDNETGEEIIDNETLEDIIVIINNVTGEIITQEDRELQTCAELNGVICLDGELCQGTSDYASDALCCFGYCEKEQKSGLGKYAGWILLVVAVLVVGWIFLKKKGKKSKPADLVKIGSKR